MAQNFDEDMRQSRALVHNISDMLVEKISIIERMQCLEKHKKLMIEKHKKLLGEHEDSSASREGPKQDKEDKAAADQTRRRRPLWIAKIRRPIVIEDNKCAEDKGAPRQRKEEDEDEENEEATGEGCGWSIQAVWGDPGDREVLEVTSAQELRYKFWWNIREEERVQWVEEVDSCPDRARSALYRSVKHGRQ